MNRIRDDIELALSPEARARLALAARSAGIAVWAVLSTGAVLGVLIALS
jgi:hypothetical protein